MGTQPHVIARFTGVIDQCLRADIKLRSTVIHERLMAQYGYRHSYQRVKMYLRQAQPRIAAELANGQVDWAEEGSLLARVAKSSDTNVIYTESHFTGEGPDKLAVAQIARHLRTLPRRRHAH